MEKISAVLFCVIAIWIGVGSIWLMLQDDKEK